VTIFNERLKEISSRNELRRKPWNSYWSSLCFSFFLVAAFTVTAAGA